MILRENSQKDRLTVSLEGDFDESACSLIENKISAALLKTAPVLYIDMRNVKYISNSGIRVLISAHKNAVKAGKKIMLVEIPQRVYNLLEVVGLLPLFS